MTEEQVATLRELIANPEDATPGDFIRALETACVAIEERDAKIEVLQALRPSGTLYSQRAAREREIALLRAVLDEVKGAIINCRSIQAGVLVAIKEVKEGLP